MSYRHKNVPLVAQKSSELEEGVGTDLYQRRTNGPTSGDTNAALAYPLMGMDYKTKAWPPLATVTLYNV